MSDAGQDFRDFALLVAILALLMCFFPEPLWRFASWVMDTTDAFNARNQ